MASDEIIANLESVVSEHIISRLQELDKNSPGFFPKDFLYDSETAMCSALSLQEASEYNYDSKKQRLRREAYEGLLGKMKKSIEALRKLDDESFLVFGGIVPDELFLATSEVHLNSSGLASIAPKNRQSGIGGLEGLAKRAGKRLSQKNKADCFADVLEKTAGNLRLSIALLNKNKLPKAKLREVALLRECQNQWKTLLYEDPPSDPGIRANNDSGTIEVLASGPFGKFCIGVFQACGLNPVSAQSAARHISSKSKK